MIAGLSSVVKYSYKLKDGEGNVLQEGSEGLVDDLIKDLPNLNTGLTIRFEDLAAGDYTFEWTSRPLFPLPQSTKSVDFIIEEPDEFEIVGLNISNIDCLNPTGSIEVLTSGGVGDIELGILNLGEINILGGDGNTITNLTEEVYYIVVTDENGCEATTTAEVESSVELPEIEITGDLDLGCHDLLDLQILSSEGLNSVGGNSGWRNRRWSCRKYLPGQHTWNLYCDSYRPVNRLYLIGHRRGCSGCRNS